MKPAAKLLLKLLILVLPFVIISIPILLSGEFLSGKLVSVLQQKYDFSILYGPIAESQYRFYKSESTRIVKPSVILMGDSRALVIHSFFFNEDIIFYNTGYTVTNTAEMQYFLESQDTSNMDVIIFALNHFSFNINWSDVGYPNHQDYITPHPPDYIANIKSQIDYLQSSRKAGKSVLTKNIFDTGLLGLNAVINSNGMLNDGSYFYGEIHYKEDDGQDTQGRMEDTLDRIENANRRFQHGERANPNAIHYLELFLQYCKDNDIYVICFAPPYAPIVNKAMKERGDAYAYQYETLEIVPRIFENFGYEFYDYTDASFLGCTDDFYLDGFHGSDVVFLRMFIDMIEHGSRLGRYCALDDLQIFNTERFSNTRLFETWKQYNKLTLLRH